MAVKKQDEPVEDPNKQDDPTRCGGYVLTNEGWVLAPTDEN
jgi:hypothetical protein